MFKKNEEHKQNYLFIVNEQLSERKQKKILESEEYLFYKLIFCNIKEEDFSVLYSNKASRPNAPINAMVSSMIIMQTKGWTYEELFKNIDFNRLTRASLGLQDINETPFTPATLFNFQDKLSHYYVKTGINLFEKVFDNLTKKQLKCLKIKTNIQRSDSFMVSSNIRNYTRLQFLIEVIICFYKIFSNGDQGKLRNRFKNYVKQSSNKYIYNLSKSDLPNELNKIKDVYHYINNELADNYKDTEMFHIFKRVLKEHFNIVDNKLEVKPSSDLSSDILQSINDVDATYRKKGNTESKGYSVNVTETCHPDNNINLITDINTCPNNKDDNKILNDILDTLKEKTPDLDELHTDAAYGSAANDEKMESLGINHIQTGIKGRSSGIDIEISKLSDDNYEVSCSGGQVVNSVKTNKRFKACFDSKICSNCSFFSKCKLIHSKSGRVYYFTNDNFLMKRRHNNLKNLPPNRHNLRPNVEATVKEFKSVLYHNKLKVRGLFKSSLFAFCKGIGINFGRIFRKCFEPNFRNPFSGLGFFVNNILDGIKLSNFLYILLKCLKNVLMLIFVSLYFKKNYS